MKRLLAILAVLLLVSCVQANTRLTFQDPNDFISQITCVGTCAWIQNASGGNDYVRLSDAGSAVMLTYAYPMTYSAATLVQSAGTRPWSVTLYDSEFNSIGGFSHGTHYSLPQRLEMKITGGDAIFYEDGYPVGSVLGLTINPSYVAWGVPGPAPGTDTGYDDIVWGSDQPLLSTAPDKYVFGSPENGYFIMKDFLNPAASGFYRVNGTTNELVYSYDLPTQFSKGNNNSEIIELNEYGGGIYQTYNSSDYNGLIEWNLTSFFASGAPYGLYTTTIEGSVSYSDTIPYIGSGAVVTFSQDMYTSEESASATIVISDGYYDTATYDYHFVIQDIFGNEVSDVPVSFTVASPHTGTATYSWDSGDGTGVYYGLMYATRISDSEEILMNYDICELTDDLFFSGYVKHAETTLGLAGATIIYSQATNNNLTSGVDGNYTTTTTSFSKDVLTGVNVTLAGYKPYSHSFTPLHAGTIQINFTLIPDAPTVSGNAIGGIVVSPPYNRTVDSATVSLRNVSTGEYYEVTTNSAGYYLKNSLILDTWYTVWGSKTSFTNSSDYFIQATGVI